MRLSRYCLLMFPAPMTATPSEPCPVAAFSGDPKSLYLKPGDIVECEIEKIGVLRNPVVSYKELHGGKSVTA